MKGICDAVAQKTEFEEVLPLLLEELRKKYRIRVDEDPLSSSIAEFLNERKIPYPPNLIQLLETDLTAAYAVGQAYHFTRKTAIKNLEFRNPVPLLQNSFGALESVPDSYAAKFLDTMCVIMTEDRRPQQNMSDILGKILPEITSEYKTALESIETVRSNGHKYQKNKTTILDGYIRILSALTDYTELVVKNGHVPSTDDFQSYRRSKGLMNVLIPKI
ncbi:MAG: hypothetical protein AABX33_07255 [Nanoarchaeota archaeon]